MKRPISKMARPMIVNCSMLICVSRIWVAAESSIAPINGPHSSPEPPSSAIATGSNATLRPNTVPGSM